MKLELLMMGFFLLYIAYLSGVTVCHEVDEEEEEDLSRTIRFHRPQRQEIGDSCEVQGRPGYCQRRSRCRRPSNRFCRLGLSPVVCCLHEPEEPARPIRQSSTEMPQTTRKRTTPIPKTTTKPMRTTIKTTYKPIRSTIRTTTAYPNEEIDIVFPGCGSRTPAAPHPPGRNDDNDERFGRNVAGRRRGGSGFFRWKRDLTSNASISGRRYRRAAIQPVIVGGVTARRNSWPWMVAIFIKTPSGDRFLCGASLISKHFVLSAAHCFEGRKISDTSKFLVSCGAHETNQGTSYTIEKILIHPEYQSKQYYNDISLLKLVREVKLYSTVYPVCLPSSSLRKQIGNTRKNVIVTGWGDSSFGGVSSKVLREVDLPIVPLKECNASYSSIAKSAFPKGITNLFLCAGYKEGGKDACQGDSGGPLVMELSNGYYVQLGIVSFGYGCADPGYPGVYTRVSKFVKWIADNTDL